MHRKLALFVLLLLTAPVFAQQEEQTLFRDGGVVGAFGGPILSWSSMSGKTGFGMGIGGGVVFDQFFIGLFGMFDTYDNIVVGQPQLASGYGGLWLGFSIPSHKLAHAYISTKLAGGAVGVTDFEDDPYYEENWNDVTFVAIPEAGLELNLTKWLRMSGSVGYRFVDGFEGWGTYGKKDLNAPVYNFTIRIGWFSKKPGSGQ